MGFHGAITGAMMIPQMWTRTLRTVALAATLLMALPGPGRAHMSDECFVHVVQMEQRMDEYQEALAETKHLTTAYAEEGIAAVESGDMERKMLYFVRLVTIQLPETFASINRHTRKSAGVAESAVAAIECAAREEKTPANAAPVDLDWLDDVMSGLDEQAPERVELGVDCTEPFMVGLPDDVLTECEGEFIGR